MSDGEHTIDARFSTAAHQTLLHLKRGDTSTGKSFGLVKLSKPGLRLINRCNPPKLELLVDSLETVTCRRLYDKHESSHGPVCRDNRVASLLRTYSVDQKTNSQVHLQPNCSPQSIKSQHHLSPDRHGRLSDEAGTQASYESQLFLTQAPFTSGSFPTVNPTQDELDHLQFIQQLQNHTKIKAECVSNLDPTIVIDEVSLRADHTKDKRVSKRTAVGSESSEALKTSRLAQPLLLIETSHDTAPRTVESARKLAADSDPRSTPAKSFAHPAHDSEGSSLNTDGKQQMDTTEDPPSQLSRPFKKWRQELRQGRYLPQYIERISTPQRKLLESNDAWQPPRVGQRARPGDVPLPLLERLSKAADALRESDSASLSFGSEISERENAQLLSEEELELKDQQHCGNVSDSETSSAAIEWSSSPPVEPKSQHSRNISDRDSTPASVELSPSPSPKQRRQFLPDDSPHPRVPEIKQNFILEGPHDGDNTIAEIESTETNLSALIAINTVGVMDSQSPGPKASSPNTEISGPSARSTLKPSQLPRDGTLEHGHKCPSVEQDHETALLCQDPTSSSVSSLSGIQNVKTILVARTPYVGKNIPSGQADSDSAMNQTQGTSLDNAHAMSSGFVRGTFSERLWEENVGPEVGSLIPEHGRTLLEPADPNACPEIDQAVHEKDQQSRQEQTSVRDGDVTADGDASEIRTSQSPLNDQELYHPPRDVVALSDQISHTTTLSEPLATRSASITLIPKHVAVNHVSASSTRATKPATLTAREPQVDSGLRVATTKRDFCDTDNHSPSKRRRIHTEAETESQLPDPDYATIFQRLRVHRREQYANFGKSTNRQSRSRSFSSSVDDHNDGTGMQTPLLRQAEGGTSNAPERGSPNQTSTPLTRLSDYDLGIADRKVTKGCAIVEPLLVPADATLESLFMRFRGLYSDYKGQLNDFNKAVKVLRKMIKIGNAPHPFVFDDIIFHHYHSYRQFLLDEVLGGEELMTYDKFYNTHITDPCHLQKLITVQVLESFSDLDNPHDLGVQPPPLQKTNSPTVKAAYDNESVTRGRHKERTIPPQITQNKTVPALQKSVEDSEQIRIPTREPSPELGTPNIDRSRSKIPKVCDSLPSNSKTQAMTVSRRSLPSSFVTPSSSSTPTYAQNRNNRVLDNTLSRSSLQRPGHAKPSRSASIKPAKDRTDRRSFAFNRGTPKRIPEWPSTVVPETREWWKDEDTPFKRFQKQHSALPSERRHMAAGAGGGINIFNWRT